MDPLFAFDDAQCQALAEAHGTPCFAYSGRVAEGQLLALRAVLPRNLPLLPVGGISSANMPTYWQAGASGFGIGSALYAPGRSAEAVAQAAAEFKAAWHRCAGR